MNELQIAVIASGRDYQEAAAWAAATYARANGLATVSVLLPAGERASARLRQHAARFGFRIVGFPFRAASPHQHTSQLKCQAAYFAVSRLAQDELLLVADADTYCLGPVTLSARLRAALLAGQVGLVPDIEDRHFQAPELPWYLAPEERATYVNSGVILAGRKARSMFWKFRQLSAQARFLHGPFNDQKVINYALGRFFRDRLELLDRSYNGILYELTPEAVIGHYAGGAGYLGVQGRKIAHEVICREILRHTSAGAMGRAKVRAAGVAAARSRRAPPRSRYADYLAAFAFAVTNGQMGPRHYSLLVRTLRETQPCNLLVFGAGFDSPLWFRCVGGNVAYVEDDPHYVGWAPANAVRFQFQSRTGHWARVPSPPKTIDRDWDFVLVDGPRGGDAQCPGRQIPIAWAARLARRAVFVHDYERPWDRAACDRYLGRPAKVVPDLFRPDRHLAVFRCAPVSARCSSQC